MTQSTTSSSISHSLPPVPFASKLSEQLSQRKERGGSSTDADSSSDRANSLGPPLRPSPKSRSLSDAARPASSTQPTPESRRPSSKDDTSLSSTISSTPETPQRPTLSQGLSLNLPSKTPASPAPSNRTPLSPKLDSSHIYGSPGSVLPRRSRGLDFSRACTNLHHSTLAESSPDSSPTVGGRGMAIPQRRGSLGSTSVPPFSTSGPADKTTVSSSVSSVNMMESDTSSSEEDDEPMMGDRDDIIMNTPQASKMGGLGPFAQANISSPGSDWMGNYSQAAASLLSFQRARFRTRRSRHSSSSASGNSSKPSPGPFSPPVMNSIENQNGGYFGHKASVGPRRESLSLGTRDLRLSDLSGDEGETRGARAHSPSGPSTEGGPLGVIRRAVTRRGSLLPKTKTFARIRAALLEENAPIDCEAKREAEVIRQVRESEPDIPQKSPSLDAFTNVNPFQPPGSTRSTEDLPVKSGTFIPDEPSFSDTAHRNSRGSEFWNSFDDRYRTPPPPPMRQLGTSISEDELAMDLTPSTTLGSNGDFAKPGDRPGSRSSTTNAAINEIKRKRRRDDDFDPNLFKRRAVSPSMSVQSSPVMPNSPAVKETNPNIWGPPPKSNLGSLFPDRPSTESSNRNSSTPQTGTLKRVGLQGMNETNDGLMNMSIE